MWRGQRNQAGYGQLTSMTDGVRVAHSAHRLSWELHRGPIPAGLWVLHHCDNPSCVNPAHLFVGTAADNTADMIAKGRGNKTGRRRKLADDQVRAIRADDRAAHYVAHQYGVSESTIYNIRAGRQKQAVI